MSAERAPRHDRFAAERGARSVGASFVALAILAAGACSRDWDAFDPRLGAGGSGATSSSSAGGGGATSSSSAGGGGATSSSSTGGGDVCVPSTTASCYSGSPSTANIGDCKSGTKTCLPDGTGYGACIGEVTPGVETCVTPGDEDCNGVANEGGAGCVCVPGTMDVCYSGPPNTDGVGSCHGGMKTCDATGLSYGACAGEVTPVVEDCGTVGDDDCNAAPNDHCALWSKQFGESGDQRVWAVAVGASDNVVLVGYMEGTADFGGGPLTSAGGHDVFVVKLDKNGNHIWSKVFGDALDQEALSVAIDGFGNVLLTGFFNGTINFGGSDLVSQGAEDLFIAKLDPTGAHVWSKAFGDAASQIGYGIAVAPNSAVAVTGSFGGTVNFGGAALTSVDMLDGFVVELTAGGNHLWSKAFGGLGDDIGRAIAIDGTSHVLLTGSFDETVNFGGLTIIDGGSIDVFVAKLDNAGAHVWSKGFPAPNTQIGHAIDVDGAGNVVVFGDTEAPVDFGGGPLAIQGTFENLFVVKLDPAGAHLWSKSFGNATDAQEAHGVAFDSAGDVLLTGGMEGTLDFGGGPLVNPGVGEDDVFVVKLAGATGQHVWSRRFGDDNDQDGRCIATDSTNAVIVAGEFAGMMDFGTGVLDNVSSDDAYVAKLAP